MENFIVRRAEMAEYESVLGFYYKLIDDMQGPECKLKWKKGIYPDEVYISDSIQKGELYIAVKEDTIISAMVLNHNENDGYEGAPWLTEVGKHEITVIHTLGVAVACANQGIGKQMVREAIRIARENGQKTIRLDAIEDNIPAHKLYERLGFTFIKTVTVSYEDIGCYNFDLYEYPLV